MRDILSTLFVSRPWLRRLKVQKGQWLFALALILLFPMSAWGQLTFDWPTTRRDTLYQTVEECLGLVSRIERHTSEIDTTNYAVLPSRLRDVPNTVPDSLVTGARQCSQKFSVDYLLTFDSLDVFKTMNVIKLLIVAKRDADVVSLVDRYVAKIPASHDTLKTFVRFQAAYLALKDYPTRFALIRKIVDPIDFKKDWQWKMRVYGKILERARELRDTAEYKSTITWLVATPKLVGDSALTTKEWLSDMMIDGEPDPPVSSYVFNAKQYLQRDTLLAKLRENVDSYAEFMNLLQKESGWTNSSKREVAKPITAKYWFPEQPATPRPTVPGKVAVVIVVPQNICNPCDWREGSWGRIAKKFPDIEFTALLKTAGHYGEYFGILPPDQEVRLIDSFHRTVYGFPGMIAVHHTQYWRIDDTYDRRVIEENGPNEDQYPLKGGFPISRIIARDGKFISPAHLAIDPDESLELFFDALLRQKSK